MLLRILWSFQKNKKDHHGVCFSFSLTNWPTILLSTKKNTSAHLVSPFLIFQPALWSRTCNLSCCIYRWNFWISRHEEIFIKFNYQEAVTKSFFYPIIGDHLLCQTFKWLFSMLGINWKRENIIFNYLLFTIFTVVKTLATFGTTWKMLNGSLLWMVFLTFKDFLRILWCL